MATVGSKQKGQRFIEVDTTRIVELAIYKAKAAADDRRWADGYE